MPKANRFDNDGTYDRFDNDNYKHRIWSFDDTLATSSDPSISNYGLVCGDRFSVVCTRPSSANPSRGDYEIPIDDTQIKVTTQKEKQMVNACITNTGFYSNKYGKYFNRGIYIKPSNMR